MAPALLTHIPFKYEGKGKLFSFANWSVSFMVQPIFILLMKSSIVVILFVNILYILYYTFQQYFAVESFIVLNS